MSSSPANAIEVENLSKVFGDIVAVDDLTFNVQQGAVVGLLGGNGAGKTTTLSMLLSLLLPTSGRITVLGEDIARHRYRVLGRMNFSSPYVDLPHRLTVQQNLEVYARLYGVRDVKRRVRELAERMDFTPLMKRPVGQLSAGQKTRVALAKALVNHPDVLLLDEPTASLDPDSADWMRGLLRDYQKETGASILLASHNMVEVERLCSHVLLMRTGRIVERGSPQELIDKYGRDTMEEVFLDIARNRGRFAEKEAAQ
ncbi:MAG: ABC transporter ATP-binding protein [Rhodospirillales bacterium]